MPVMKPTRKEVRLWRERWVDCNYNLSEVSRQCGVPRSRLISALKKDIEKRRLQRQKAIQTSKSFHGTSTDHVNYLAHIRKQKP